MKKKVVPKLRQEVKVDIVTSDDIKIYYSGKFQDFTARYMIKVLTKLSNATVRSVRKNNTDQNWGNGILLRAIGNATNVKPGPVEDIRKLTFFRRS